MILVAFAPKSYSHCEEESNPNPGTFFFFFFVVNNLQRSRSTLFGGLFRTRRPLANNDRRHREIAGLRTLTLNLLADQAGCWLVIPGSHAAAILLTGRVFRFSVFLGRVIKPDAFLRASRAAEFSLPFCCALHQGQDGAPASGLGDETLVMFRPGLVQNRIVGCLGNGLRATPGVDLRVGVRGG